MQTLKKFLFLFSSKERFHAGLLLIMIVIMALLDMIGVASILPFMTVLTNPDLIETNIFLKKIFKLSTFFGVKNNQEFIFSLGFLVFLLLIISLSFKTLTTYAQIRFVKMREYSIGKRLVEGYLNKPYSWFLFRINILKNCDIIFKLEKGKFIGQGSFDELIYGNSNFNKKS